MQGQIIEKAWEGQGKGKAMEQDKVSGKRTCRERQEREKGIRIDLGEMKGRGKAAKEQGKGRETKKDRVNKLNIRILG